MRVNLTQIPLLNTPDNWQPIGWIQDTDKFSLCPMLPTLTYCEILYKNLCIQVLLGSFEKLVIMVHKSTWQQSASAISRSSMHCPVYPALKVGIQFLHCAHFTHFCYQDEPCKHLNAIHLSIPYITYVFYTQLHTVNL